MNLFKLLLEREAAGKPLRVGLIGAGKFGSMFLAQARRTRGLHVMGVADLAPDRARDSLQRVGWPAESLAARSPGEAVDRGTTWVGADAKALIAHPALEVAIEATGHPPSGIAHALAAIANGKHIVMVTVEADALAGPLLAAKARAASTASPMATSRHSSPSRSTGRGPAASTWWPRARARSTCRITIARRRKPCGPTTGSAPKRRGWAA
jgi:predicted homoserine dehydrogenase-like protein